MKMLALSLALLLILAMKVIKVRKVAPRLPKREEDEIAYNKAIEGKLETVEKRDILRFRNGVHAMVTYKRGSRIHYLCWHGSRYVRSSVDEMSKCVWSLTRKTDWWYERELKEFARGR